MGGGGSVAGMPGELPQGEPVPADGTLPEGALAGLGRQEFGVYVHVPFCATRCGYCDFNTYTPMELGGVDTAQVGPGGVDTAQLGPAGAGAAQVRAGRAAVSLDSYPDLAIAEIRFARKVLGSTELPVSTVFFGGGTPTLLPPDALGAILRAIDGEFGLRPGAEVTTEANPESVDEGSLARLRAPA